MYRIEVSDPKRIGRDKRSGKPRYSVRILIYDEVTNKRVVDTARRVTAINDDEAKAMAEAEAEALKPTSEGTRPKRGAKGKLGPTWDLWIESVKRFGSAQTWKSIGVARVKPDFGEHEARTISTAQWRKWFERQLPTCSVRYARSIRSAVQAFYTWCVRNGVAGVTHNPIDASTAFGRQASLRDDPDAILDRLRAQKEEDAKRHLELDEIAKFLAVYRSARPQTYDVWLLMSACALRSHEAVAVEPELFDFRNPSTVRLAVQQGITRGRLGPTKDNEKRWVDVPPSVVPMVLERIERAPEITYRGRAHHFLFPSLEGGRKRNAGQAPVVSYESINRHVNAVKRLAGIRSANVAHMARHTAALLAMQAPEAATQRAFGHATLEQHRAYGAAPRGVVGAAIDAQLAPKLPTGNVHALEKRRVKRGVKSGRG